MTALVQQLRSTHPFRLPAGIGRSRVLGPGLLVAVGFVDPGNWATDMEAGSRYGYGLLATVVVASGLGWLFQHLSARMALATGQDLASLIRRHLPAPFATAAWLAAEVAIATTTVAELLGAAVALQLLIGLPLSAGVAVAALSGSLLLMLPRQRQAGHEYVVAGLLAWVALSFLALLFWARPQPGQILSGLLGGGEALHHPAMLALSASLIGATVMPHNLYLHSGLVADLARAVPPAGRARLAHQTERDTRRGLGLAAVVNLAILVLAAASLGQAGRAVDTLAHAHAAIAQILGSGAALVFALALFAAGQSSAVTSLLAGRQIRQGFDRGHRHPAAALWLNRGAGIAASLLLVMLPGTDPDRLLVWTQSLLVLVLPMALLPLLILASRRSLMGNFALGRPLQTVAIAAAALILWLDAGQLADMY